MIKKIVRLFIFSWIFLLSPLWAATINLTVERNSTSLEESIEAKITLQGVQGGPPPQIQNTSNFQIQQRGKSSLLQIINGQTSRSIVYRFTLYPKKEGKFLIGPAIVNIQGQTIKSQQISLQISRSSQIQKEKLYFVQASLDQPSAYLNEQIVYTFRFFTRARLADAQFDPPPFKNFWQEKLGKNKRYQTQIEGITWLVNEFKIALFPTKAGKIEIPPASLTAEFVLESKRHSPFNSFFGNSVFSQSQTKEVRLTTRPLEIQVKPLPLEGRPPHFSGLVGKVQMRSKLSKKSLAVGESSTLTLTLQGENHLREAQIPTPSTPQWNKVKIYDDEPSLKIQPSKGRLLGTKIFKKAIVPLKQGILKLPPLSFHYFDPEEEKYKTVTTSSFQFNISPGKEETLSHISASQPLSKKQKIKVLGQDIMPLKRTLNALENDVLSRSHKKYFLLFAFLCLFAQFMALKIKKYRNKINQDTNYLKRSTAYKNFISQLKNINLDKNFFEQSSQALRSYLGDKLNIDGKAMTASDTQRFLAHKKIYPENLKKIEEQLKDYEMGQFGGRSLSKDQKKEMVQKLKRLVQNLEKEIKR